jgi:hypothetical protein
LQDACILEHQPSWPVSVLCEVLGVGRSGLYAYQKRQAVPARRREAIDLLERIKAISEKTTYSSGSRRMTTQRQDAGDEGGRFQGIRMKLSIDSFRKHDGFVLLT